MCSQKSWDMRREGNKSDIFISHKQEWTELEKKDWI